MTAIESSKACPGCGGPLALLPRRCPQARRCTARGTDVDLSGSWLHPAARAERSLHTR